MRNELFSLIRNYSRHLFSFQVKSDDPHKFVCSKCIHRIEEFHIYSCEVAANQEILQFSSANSIIISNEKCRIVQLHEYVVTLQTNGQNHTATIDLNQFLPVVDEGEPITDLGVTILNNAEANDDKVTDVLPEAEESIEMKIEMNDPNIHVPPAEVETTNENQKFRKSKRLSQPRATRKVKQKLKAPGIRKKIKAEVIESDVSPPKEDIADDNNDVYDSDGTVDLNESEDEKCDEQGECDVFLDHEKFAGFPKVIIENSKLIFRGKKLLDLLSK